MGPQIWAADAQQLRRKKPSHKDIWHSDAVVISIGGRKHWLWRAVDQHGYVLDEIVQARRDTKAAKRLLMQGFRSVGGLQRFISVFSAIGNIFVPPKQKRSALATHIHRTRAMAQREAVTGATA